jgi:hypothetical protein
MCHALLKRCTKITNFRLGVHEFNTFHFPHSLPIYVIYTYKNGCMRMRVRVRVRVCVCVCPGITLERLERFRPNLVHTLLYVCVRILCMF